VAGLKKRSKWERNTVERFTDDANAHNNLAHTQLALKRYAEALVSARAALKLNPGLVQAKSHEQLALAGLKEAQTRLNRHNRQTSQPSWKATKATQGATKGGLCFMNRLW